MPVIADMRCWAVVNKRHIHQTERVASDFADYVLYHVCMYVIDMFWKFIILPHSMMLNVPAKCHPVSTKTSFMFCEYTPVVDIQTLDGFCSEQFIYSCQSWCYPRESRTAVGKSSCCHNGIAIYKPIQMINTCHRWCQCLDWVLVNS